MNLTTLQSFLAENNITPEELQTALTALQHSPKSDLLGKCFKSGNVYYKVISPSATYKSDVTCLAITPSPTLYKDGYNTITLSDNIRLEEIYAKNLTSFTKITPEKFEAVLMAWTKELLTLTI